MRHRILTSIFLITATGVERTFFYGILGSLFKLIERESYEFWDVHPAFILAAALLTAPGAWITQKFLGVRLAIITGLLLQFAALLIFFLGLPFPLAACALIATGAALFRPAMLAGLWSAGSGNHFNDFGRFSILYLVIHLGSILSGLLFLSEPGGFGYIILIVLYVIVITGLILAGQTGLWQQQPEDSGITSWSPSSSGAQRFIGLPMVLMLLLFVPAFYLLQKNGGPTVFSVAAVVLCVLMIAVSSVMAGVMKGGSGRSAVFVLTAGVIFGVQFLVKNNFDKPYMQIGRFEESLETTLFMVEGIWNGIGALVAVPIGLVVMWLAGRRAPEILLLASFLLFGMVYAVNLTVFRPLLSLENLIPLYSAASAMFGCAQALLVSSVFLVICRNVSRNMVVVNLSTVMVFSILFTCCRRIFEDYDLPLVSEGIKLALGIAVVVMLIVLLTVWKKKEESPTGPDLTWQDPFLTQRRDN